MSATLQTKKLDSKITKMTIQYENGTAQEVKKGSNDFSIR